MTSDAVYYTRTLISFDFISKHRNMVSVYIMYCYELSLFSFCGKKKKQPQDCYWVLSEVACLQLFCLMRLLEFFNFSLQDFQKQFLS